MFPAQRSTPILCACLLAAGFLWTIPVRAQTRPTGTLIVANMNDNTANILDASTGAMLATLPTGEGPHEVAVSHDGRWALVSNYGAHGRAGHTITVIDVRGRAVDRTIALPGYERPHGMVFLPGDSVFAVTCETRQLVLLVNFHTGQVLKTLPTRGRATHMVGIPAAGNRLFTSNVADASISLLDPLGADSALLIPVGRQPEGIAAAPDGNSVWAGSNLDHTVTVVDVGRRAAVDTLGGFGLAYRLAFTPDSRTVVVTDPVRDEVRIIDAASRQTRFTIAPARDSLLPTAEIAGSPSPEGVTTSADGRWAFVTLQGRNRVITIDLARGSVVAFAPIGNWSDGIGYSTLAAQ